MQWAQEQRLQFIEQQLFWGGKVNRGDIAEEFGVSIVQASKDLRAYREMHPENVVYDPKVKSYQPSHFFTPTLTQPSCEKILHQQVLENNHSEVIPLPGRNINPSILREVMRSVSNDVPIRISYQSLSRPQPSSRAIRPHTFISDGKRWHVRGYCGETGGFRDFLLGRILEASLIENSQNLKGAKDDIFWNNEVLVCLGPHPGLTLEQQAVIERDYGMTNGEVSISLRQAYLPYFLRHMNLVKETDRAREQQLVIRNREDVDCWHKEVMPAREDGEGA